MRHAIKQHNLHHYHYSSSVWSAQYIISYIRFVPVLLIKAFFFALYGMACDFKARINQVFSHNFLLTLTESPAFRKKNRIIPGKCRSKSRTSYTLHLKRLFNTNATLLSFSIQRLFPTILV